MATAVACVQVRERRTSSVGCVTCGRAVVSSAAPGGTPRGPGHVRDPVPARLAVRGPRTIKHRPRHHVCGDWTAGRARTSTVTLGWMRSKRWPSRCGRVAITTVRLRPARGGTAWSWRSSAIGIDDKARTKAPGTGKRSGHTVTERARRRRRHRPGSTLVPLTLALHERLRRTSPALAQTAIAVPLAVFFALQRYFVQGLLAGSVK